MSRRTLKIVGPIVAGAIVVALWYAIHFWVIAEEQRFLYPTPGAILTALWDNGPYLARAALNTSQAALLGFVSAVAVGFACSLLLSWSPVVRASLYPYLMAIQLTPLPVLAPIAVIWFGGGLVSVTLLTFAIAFFPLVVNTTQGLISADRNLVELFASYRASRVQELFQLRVPAAMPYFFTGLRIAATLAPIGAVVADMNAGTSAGDGGGLGFAVTIFNSHGKFPALFAAAAVTCVLGFIFNAAILALSWFALHRWHDSYERSDR